MSGRVALKHRQIEDRPDILADAQSAESYFLRGRSHSADSGLYCTGNGGVSYYKKENIMKECKLRYKSLKCEIRAYCHSIFIPWKEYPDLEIPQKHGGYLDWRVVPYRRTVTILALAVSILYLIKEGKWLLGLKRW